MNELLAADVTRLTALLVDVCEHRRHQRDRTRHELHQAVRALLVAFPVYRTYVRASVGTVRREDEATVAAAVARVAEERPDIDADLLGFLSDLLLLRLPDRTALEDEWVMRFQQLTGPAMAKGVEDTAMYRATRLLTLNEVGGDLARFGVSVDAFHEANAAAHERWPTTMTTLSTHDTKRSADVRARLALLSEIPAEWEDACGRWIEASSRHWPGGEADRHTQHLLFQTLVGAWPLTAERAAAYLDKATREAKQRTSWTSPDPAFDAARDGFVAGVFGDPGLLDDVAAFVGPLVEPGRVTALAQALLQLTSPGVPDTYQGAELWDLSLVDPDNRRPVDFSRRRELLATVGSMSPDDLRAALADPDDPGGPKLRLVREALHLRRRRPAVFGPGEAGAYSPLAFAGRAAGHAVGFTRGLVAPTTTAAATGTAELRRWPSSSLAWCWGWLAEAAGATPPCACPRAAGRICSREPAGTSRRPTVRTQPCPSPTSSAPSPWPCWSARRDPRQWVPPGGGRGNGFPRRNSSPRPRRSRTHCLGTRCLGAVVSGADRGHTHRRAAVIVSVWAPRAARSVEVVCRRRVGLTPTRGRWSGDVPRLGPGDDYALSIDGGPPRPDPRSAHQPHGIEGPSRVVDHGAFRWTDERWTGFDLASAVLYELHVGTFSAEGTFDGAIAHLDHLVALGVDAVELLPVVEFPGRRGWGYDGVDLWAPHHAYGGPDGLKRLVDACHARGLGVVLDVVYNHLGPAGNHLAELGPYFADRHPTNWGPGLNVDGPGSDAVRAFVVDNARMWLRDYHVDGLRLDAVHAIADESATHVLEELAGSVRALAGELGRTLWLLPESDLNAPRFVLPPERGGYGLDAAWADEWHHALHAALTGETSGYYEDFGSLALLAKALRQAWVYDGVYSPHRRPGARAVAGGAARRPVRRVCPEPRPGRQPGAGRPVGAPRVARPRAHRRRPAADVAVRAAAVPGRGVGGVDAVPVLHRPRGRRARAGRVRGAAAGVLVLRVGARGRARPAGPRHLRRLGAPLGRGGVGRARRGARLVPGADRPAACPPGARRRTARRRHRGVRRARPLARRAPASCRRVGGGEPGERAAGRARRPGEVLLAWPDCAVSSTLDAVRLAPDGVAVVATG